MSEKEHVNYPSRFEIGESVVLSLNNYGIPCYIRAVTFTNGKVRYSLYVKNDKTTIHNVDSYFVNEDVDSKENVKFDFDNYS